jgi:hypothetical protein
METSEGHESEDQRVTGKAHYIAELLID